MLPEKVEQWSLTTLREKLVRIGAEVVCIAKGKADEKYGFGRKVALAATNREGFAVASKAFAGNPYDGHDLRQGRPPWPLCHLPTGRGRSIERPIPEIPEPDR